MKTKTIPGGWSGINAFEQLDNKSDPPFVFVDEINVILGGLTGFEAGKPLLQLGWGIRVVVEKEIKYGFAFTFGFSQLSGISPLLSTSAVRIRL
jgi:hypothetical protein